MRSWHCLLALLMPVGVGCANLDSVSPLATVEKSDEAHGAALDQFLDELPRASTPASGN